MYIYIPEHIPSENKGEEAILQGIYHGLKKQTSDLTISVFSYEPDVDKANYGSSFKVVSGITFRPPYGNISRPVKILKILSIWFKHFNFVICYRLLGNASFHLFKGENWRELIDADVIVVGHDAVFSDVNILYALLVKLLGKKATIFGVGFGKFRFKMIERLASKVLPFIDLVVVREKRTSTYFKSLTSRPDKIFLKPDPAFLMEPIRGIPIDEMMKKEGINKTDKPLIGVIVTVGLSYYKFNDGIFNSEEERYESYMCYFSKIVEAILKETGGTVVFIPHCLKSANWKTDDRVCGRSVVERMRKGKEDVILVEDDYNAATLKGFMEQLDFLVSMRLHAVIGAGSVGLPFIMVATKEDQRSHDIVENCIGRPDLIYDINQSDIDTFTRCFKEKWEQREEIRQYLLKRGEFIKEETSQAFELLSKLSTAENAGITKT